MKYPPTYLRDIWQHFKDLSFTGKTLTITQPDGTSTQFDGTTNKTIVIQSSAESYFSVVDGKLCITYEGGA